MFIVMCLFISSVYHYKCHSLCPVSTRVCAVPFIWLYNCVSWSVYVAAGTFFCEPKWNIFCWVSQLEFCCCLLCWCLACLLVLKVDKFSELLYLILKGKLCFFTFDKKVFLNISRTSCERIHSVFLMIRLSGQV